MSLNAKLLRDSFNEMAAKQPEMTTKFYEQLFGRYPNLRKLFSAKDTKKQAEMLQSALVSVLDHIEDEAWLKDTLLALGKKHKDYGVTDDMYAMVGDVLLDTMAATLKLAMDNDIILEWGKAYTAIANIMKEGAK